MTIGSATCPACGLAVSPGYPKCPKCHAAMPAAEPVTPSQDAQARKVQGGTSVEGGPAPFVWIAVAGVVAVIAVVVYISRGSDKKQAPAPAPAPAVGPAIEPAQQPAQPDVDPFAGTGPNPEDVAKADRARARAFAAEQVAGALDSARVWGTVEVQGAALHIHSAYCAQIGDELLAAARDAAGSPLFDSVSCFERHGPLAWERPLSGGGASP